MGDQHRNTDHAPPELVINATGIRNHLCCKRTPAHIGFVQDRPWSRDFGRSVKFRRAPTDVDFNRERGMVKSDQTLDASVVDEKIKEKRFIDSLVTRSWWLLVVEGIVASIAQQIWSDGGNNDLLYGLVGVVWMFFWTLEDSQEPPWGKLLVVVASVLIASAWPMVFWSIAIGGTFIALVIGMTLHLRRQSREKAGR
jgi:hypothetical protein